MKKLKKILALALAFVLAAALLPVMGKEVKAGDDGSVIWSAETYQSTYNGVVDPDAVTVGDVLTVDALGNATATNTWNAKNQSDGAGVSKFGISGSENPALGTRGDYTTAPTTGIAVKVTVTKPGTLSAVVLANSGKKILFREFESNTLTGGVSVLEDKSEYMQSSTKAWTTISGSVQPGKDYYIYVDGSKMALNSITFIPTAEESIVSTIGAAYREEGGSYGNGVRFGSELDKTSADYSNIQESGTLIAIQEVVGQDTELTMNTNKCKPVKRTTVYSEDDSKLQYTVVVINIPEEKKDSVLVARPYVKMNDGTVVYGTQISGSWNSIQAAVTGTVE